MPLLIDCYNLLHEPMPPSLAGLDTAGLCRKLATSKALWKVWFGQPMTVVCDGVPSPLGITESPVPEVELIYAGRGIEADVVIQELVELDTAPRRLVVVSSDRGIQKAAARRRARVMSSAALVKLLAFGLPSAPGAAAEPVTRTTALNDDEVEQWLQAFGLDPDKDPLASPKKKPWWEDIETDA